MPFFAYSVSSISTHALTWRATAVDGIGNLQQADFYPRPHMEGDFLLLFYTKGGLKDFYPRPHMEGDLTVPQDDGSERDISTHALTWRATFSPVRTPKLH